MTYATYMVVAPMHGRKSRGGTNPPRIGSGGTLIQVVTPDFCDISKFQALAMDSSPQIYATDRNPCRA
jgi:hypothetical protein